MLRAVRLAAKLGFQIAAEAAEPIPRMAGLLADASNARLFDESLKMFMSGHGAESLLGLETVGLLPVLFPDTAAALAADGSGQCRALMLEGLRGTDARVREDKPVTPAFLFAALLWPAYANELAKLLSEGHELAVAEQRAADRITLRQTERIGIPRRFSVPMHEIWFLQSRFPLRQRKRVFRLRQHPRFKAAYDFLELRAAVVPELAAERDWWKGTLELDDADLAERLDRQAPAGKAPRRRRRGGRRG
jgi:poly(A) polymerase